MTGETLGISGINLKMTSKPTDGRHDFGREFNDFLCSKLKPLMPYIQLRSELPLADPEGKEVAILGWKAERPGLYILKVLAAPLAALLIAFATLMIKAVRRLKIVVSYQEELHLAKAAAEEANRSKSDFLANMSHELRTPLNAILGFSEIIKEGMFGTHEKYSEYGRDIHTSASHLLEIVSDLLDLAKLEAGKQDLQEKVFPASEPVSYVHRLLHERAEDKSVCLNVSTEGPDFPIRADERIIRQILLNLVANAIKFTPQGGWITIEHFVDHYGRPSFTVKDTGIGIPEDKLSPIGQPFMRLHAPHDARYQGVGLGLSLVSKLVEIHGGEFIVNSALQQGTTVTVSLPATRLVGPE